jgi:hypothetical protein
MGGRSIEADQLSYLAKLGGIMCGVEALGNTKVLDYFGYSILSQGLTASRIETALR